jgi:phosphoribosylaminoimidazolecarboxamide formyltransferase / IMP cyclohydrolase
MRRTASTTTHSDHADFLAASEAVSELLAVRTAIATVSDKQGLLELGCELAKYRIEVIATEGTAKHLRELKGLILTDLTAYTGYPENLNGRLKTLHPKIQAGVLAVRGFHDEILSKPGIQAKFIDLIIVNLYPFERVVGRGAPFFECIENIDIGGPALLRAGAKNHACVTVICDPADYDPLIAELQRHGGKTSLDFRRRCAQKVFKLTSKYDAAIAAWFETRPYIRPDDGFSVGSQGRISLCCLDSRLP